MEWTEELATGITLIDDQHKELFRRINALLDAGKQGKGRQAVAETLDFLEDYVKVHFAAEEAIQKEHAYPEYTAHKKMHEDFLRDVAKLRADFELKGPSLTMMLDVNQVVVDWLIKHIKKVDKALAEYLRKYS